MVDQVRETRNPFLEARERYQREYYLRLQIQNRQPDSFKCLLIMTAVLLTVLLPVFYCLTSLMHIFHQRQLPLQEIIHTTCSTNTCLSEAAQLSQQPNFSANPCVDFYEFACGNLWQKFGKTGGFLDDLHEKSAALLSKLYDEPNKDTDHVMVAASKKLYRACVAEFEEPRLVASRILRALWTAEISKSPDGVDLNEEGFDWLEQTYKLREVGLSHAMFLEVSITKHPENKSRHIFKVSLPNITMVEKEVLVDVAQTLGLDDNQTSSEIGETYRLMHTLNMPDNLTYYDNICTISEYQVYQQTNWLRFINTILTPGVQASRRDLVVFPPVAQVMHRLTKLSQVPKRIQANYVMWKIVEEVAPDLILTMRHKHGYVPPHQQVETREARCLNLLRERFVPNPMDILYIQKYLIKKKEASNTLAQDVKEQVFQVLNKADWLDQADRERSIETLNDMALVVGAPQHYFRDGLLDDLNVDMEALSANNFVDILLQFNRNYQTFRYKQIKNPVLQWNLHLLDVHPHFSEDNVMEIPAAVLQMFGEDRPFALNYATLGTYIGSSQIGQLMFGTKSEAGKEDVKWSLGTQKALMKRQMCLGEMFGRNSSAGILDVEMISEVISTKVAYLAYRKRFSGYRSEERLVDLRFSTNQLFWMKAMSQWCSRSKPLELDFEQTKYESFRAFMMGANNAYFAQDFGCPTGSIMNPGDAIAKCGLY